MFSLDKFKQYIPYDNFVSYRRNALYFPHSFYIMLQEPKFASVYYNSEDKVIALYFHNEEILGAIPITRSKLQARIFLQKFCNFYNFVIPTKRFLVSECLSGDKKYYVFSLVDTAIQKPLRTPLMPKRDHIIKHCDLKMQKRSAALHFSDKVLKQFQYVEMQVDYSERKIMVCFFKDEESKTPNARKIVKGAIHAPELVNVKRDFVIKFEKIVEGDAFYSIQI